MTTNEFKEADHTRDNKKRFAEHKPSEPTIDPLKPMRPRKPGELGGYQVKAHKVLRNVGMEGDGFTATVYRDGKAAFAVSNDGNGGDNRYSRVITANMPVETLDEARAKAIECQEAIAAFNELAGKATGASFGPGDSFVALLVENASIERFATKNRLSRESIVEEAISQGEEDELWSDEEKNTLRNPDSLFE